MLPDADAFAAAFTQDKLLAEVRCCCKLGRGGGQTIPNCLKLKLSVSHIIVIMCDHIRGGAQAPRFRLMRMRMMDQLQQVPTIIFHCSHACKLHVVTRQDFWLLLVFVQAQSVAEWHPVLSNFDIERRRLLAGLYNASVVSTVQSTLCVRVCGAGLLCFQLAFYVLCVCQCVCVCACVRVCVCVCVRAREKCNLIIYGTQPWWSLCVL